MSQAELVQRLRDRGWVNVHPTTISRIEKGERPVRLSEATRIAQVLGQDLYRMMTRPSQAGIEEEVDKYTEKVANYYNQVLQGAYWLQLHRRVLRGKLDELAAVAEREGDERLRQRHEEAEPYLQLRIDKAVREAREAAYGPGGEKLLEFYTVSPHAYEPDWIDEAEINAPNA